MPSAFAVENGSDADGNPVVVQIQLTFSNYSTTCSGALMAPRIVVTADHCIKLVGESNKSNLIQSAKVAPAGARRDGQGINYVKVTDFIFTPREGKNGAAFLVLESDLTFKLPVRIASATDIDNLQANKTPIKFIGYGTSDKNEVVYKNLPQIAYGELFKDLENQRVHFRSYPATSCQGDSGGPIYQQLDNELLLIGVINGPWYVDLKSRCSLETINPQNIRQDKLYKYSVYIPLYTPDAVFDAKLAAEKVLASPTKQISNFSQMDYEAVLLDYKQMMDRIATLKQRYVNNSQLIAMEKKMLNLPIGSGSNLSTAIYNIQSVNKKLESSIKVWDQIYITKIECVKGSIIKKISAKNPKCPKGYKINA
jgi:V8-like Glu-specific endopeptidase